MKALTWFHYFVVLSCLALLISGFTSCRKPEKVKKESIFDMVNNAIGISLDPAYFTINTRYYEWSPKREDIEWAFGESKEIDAQTLVYEKLGLIVHLHKDMVETLELLYDAKAGSYPCQKAFQGMIFVNGMQIPSTSKTEQVEALFSDFDMAKEKGVLKFGSKTEHMLLVSNEYPQELLDQVKQHYLEDLRYKKVKELLFTLKDNLSYYDSLKEGFYLVPKGYYPAIESYLVKTLKVEDYALMSKRALLVVIHFDPISGYIQKIVVQVGVHKKRYLELT
ncbi:MAG TPA: hypothetical protein PK581_07700 [Caldisericia bacterium]|nr:hypothetical protein [Caldisericia bacterium]